MVINLFGKGDSRLLAFGRRWGAADEHWYLNDTWLDPHFPPADKIFYFDKVVESWDTFKDVDRRRVINGDNFPLTEIMKSVPGALPYFTSSIAYALAFACLAEPRILRLWGIDLNKEEEYHHQLPCVMFWLGVLAAHDTEIEVAYGSSVFADRTQLYGDVSWKSTPFTFIGQPSI